MHQNYLQSLNIIESINHQQNMEDLSIHPFFRSKAPPRSSIIQLKKNYTSPNLQQYQQVTQRYSNYLNNLNAKIDKICEKQTQRNCFKEQKLNIIKSQLMKKKNELQKTLQEKVDPTKTQNGSLFIQINELTKLETSYKEIHQTLTEKIKKKQEEINSLRQTVKKQKKDLKNTMKDEIASSVSSSRISSLPRLTGLTDSSVLSHQSRVSYNSKARQSVLSKLQRAWSEKTNTVIDTQEQKLTILKLLCVYARSKTESHALNMHVIDLIERQVKMKQEYLWQIKQLKGRSMLMKNITTQ